MQCPVDNTTLVMSDRQGIEIDYCPQCRGVWLDRGEIDKIVERSQRETAQFGEQPNASSHSNNRYDDRRRDYDDDDDRRYSGHNQSHGHGQHKRKESWFGELFD